jgi:nucleotide-binding universal stress UspA family protein
MSAEPEPHPCIVAGFDDSPSGFDAVALGRQLATAIGARLIVAHVYLDAISAIDIVPPPELVAERREAAMACAQRARFVLEGFDRWTPIAYAAEPAARGLHEVAEHAGAEMIVVGSTHRHGLGQVVPGSTGERLLHGSSRPIVIAPAGWRADVIRTVGAGFDGSPESHAALAAAATLATGCGASLRALRVFDAPSPANPVYAVTGHGYGEIMHELRADRRARLELALEHLPVAVEADAELLEGRPVEVLAAESERLDVLVIGSRGYGAMRATLVGSVAHELVRSARCPLMLVPRGVAHPLEGLAQRGT